MSTKLNSHHKYTQLDEDITLAVQLEKLQESMNNWEKEIAQPNSFIRLWKNMPNSARVLSPIAVAAMLVGFIFYCPGITNAPSSMQLQYSTYSSLMGSNDVTHYLDDAEKQMKKGEFSKASSSAGKALIELNYKKSLNPRELSMICDALWYRAISDLSRRQLFYKLRAQKDLEKLVELKAEHKEDAQKLLDELCK